MEVVKKAVEIVKGGIPAVVIFRRPCVLMAVRRAREWACSCLPGQSWEMYRLWAVLQPFEV